MLFCPVRRVGPRKGGGSDEKARDTGATERHESKGRELRGIKIRGRGMENASFEETRRRVHAYLGT